MAPTPGQNETLAVLAAVSTIAPEVEPIVLLVYGLFKAHQAANAGKFPTPEEVQTSYQNVTDGIKSLWASYVPSGR